MPPDEAVVRSSNTLSASSSVHRLSPRDVEICEDACHRGKRHVRPLATLTLALTGAFIVAGIAHPQNSTEIDRLFELGAAAESRGKPEEAIPYFNEVLRMQPGNFGVRAWLGNALLETHDIDAAIEQLRIAVMAAQLAGHVRDFAGTRCHLGTALRKRGSKEDAVKEFETGLKEDPDSAVCYDQLGHARFDWGQYQDAIASWARSIDLRPSLTTNYYNIGFAKYKLAEYQAAIEEVTKYLAAGERAGSSPAEPEDIARGNVLLGDSYDKIGAHSEALSAYRRAAEAGHDFRSECLADAAADFNTDLQYCRRFIQLNPTDGLANYLYGRVLAWRNDDYATAEPYLRRAVQLNPDVRPFRTALASLYLHTKDYSPALAESLSAVNLAPNTSYQWDYDAFEGVVADYLFLEIAAYKTGNYDEVIPAVRFRQEVLPQLLTVNDYYRLGTSYLIVGKHSDAARTFREAVRRFPGDSSIRDWLAVSVCASEGWRAAVKGSSVSPGILRGQLIDGLIEVAVRADDANMRYAALFDYSFAFSTLVTMVQDLTSGNSLLRDEQVYVGSREAGTPAIRSNRRLLLERVYSLYAQLPLKPAPPMAAVARALEAEDDIKHDRFHDAQRAYDQALIIAPWWPEAHYNLALVWLANAIDPKYSLPLQQDPVIAVEELKAYLELAPAGPYADDARARVKWWEHHWNEDD